MKINIFLINERDMCLCRQANVYPIRCEIMRVYRIGMFMTRNIYDKLPFHL